MPELPEVETVVRDLRGELAGRRVVDVTVLRASVIRFPDAVTFARGLRGARLGAVRRRGKYIVTEVGTAADELELVVHLGMSGHLDLCARRTPLRAHTHVRLRLDDGRELRFADARRFGRVLLGPRALLEARGVLPRLGVEPLSPEFTAEALDLVLRRTTRRLKTALLDQRGVAGLGNIYVDEAAFRAGVRPSRRCHRLTRAQRARLHAAIVEVLTAAVGNRGSSVDEYRDPFDGKGSHQEALLVYGRGGRPCVSCGRSLRRTVIAGRATIYCTSCQR